MLVFVTSILILSKFLILLHKKWYNYNNFNEGDKYELF